MSRILLLLILTTQFWADEIQDVMLHPLFATPYFSCTEHWAGQLGYPGDALGKDCMIQEFVTEEGRSWLRSHKGNGYQNEDWYSFSQDVLSPVSGTVKLVRINDVLNQPGIMGKGFATFVLIEREDGLSVLVAHLKDLLVEVDSQVKAGQVLGKVGNNGQSRHPHIHIGAYHGKEALQIRFDQKAVAGFVGK